MNSAAEKAAALRSALREGVRTVSAPSLFPTPAGLAKRLARMVVRDAGERALEPSAGTGRIADALSAAGASVDCVEIVPDLASALRYRTTCADFLSIAPSPVYDCIAMNPPFERGQDAQHVRHAFGFLRGGGRLAAVVGEGLFFRDDRADFRRWLAENVGKSEQLPTFSFRESGTDVSTRVVYIEKP